MCLHNRWKNRELFDEEARKRLKLSNESRALVPKSEKGRARDQLGKAFSVGGRIIDMAEVINKITNI